MTDEERGTLFQIKRYVENNYELNAKVMTSGKLVLDTSNVYYLDHEDKVERLEEDVESTIKELRHMFDIDFDYELSIDRIIIEPLF